MDSNIDKIREIRKIENVGMKPTPYLKDVYEDDTGLEHDVVLRNYQKQGIMNLLVCPKMILADDTGLGKTIQILSTIGYIWLKEPEYVPIILTRKSALHQWSQEVNKFMKGMDTVTIDGDPSNRMKSYDEFFDNYDINNKRLLILSYNVLLKDTKESVIRVDHKAQASDKKSLIGFRKLLKKAKESVDEEYKSFEAWFKNRPFEVWEHAKKLVLNTEPEDLECPNNWSQEDQEATDKYKKIVDVTKVCQSEYNKYDEIVNPTIIYEGILNKMNELLRVNPNVKFMLVMDEVHAVKNHKGMMHDLVNEISKLCDRVYGLTATPVKNRLMEFYSIFRIVVPGLFRNVTMFRDTYCVTKLQKISFNKSVLIIVGYKNLTDFVDLIEPYFLSRRKHDVATELPRLVTKELICELTELQEEIYDMAESGMLNKNSEDDEESSAAILSSMTYIQEAANSPKLLKNSDDEPFEGNSSKIDTLLELLEDELSETKTIIFSRFEKMVTLIQESLKSKKIKCVRITGKENKASDREKAKSIFQDSKSGVNVILITEAGSESINLQTAEHFIFIDSPWSWGTYSQLIGRMIRIGSNHSMTVATHMMAVKRNGDSTIDHYVVKKLKMKKALADKVSGDGLKDGLKFVSSNDAVEIYNMIKEDKKVPKKSVKSGGTPKAPKKPSKLKKNTSSSKNDTQEEKTVAIDLDLSEI